MKALVGAFNQEKALVGAFSVIVKNGCGTDGALHGTNSNTGDGESEGADKSAVDWKALAEVLPRYRQANFVNPRKWMFSNTLNHYLDSQGLCLSHFKKKC